MKKSIRLSIAFLFLVLAIGTGYSMFLRSQEELLWGYRSLWLLLFGWFFLVLLVSPRFSKLSERAQWFGWTSLSGVLLGLGSPEIIPTPFLLFVGWIPLLWVEDQISKKEEHRSHWTVFRYSYHTFAVWNIVATYWVTNSAIAAGLFAIFTNSLLMAGYFTLFHITKKKLPKLGNWAFILYWMTFEYMHLNWDLTWPWLNLGNGFAEYLSWIQWYEFTGTFGGTLWILLLNVWIYQLIKARLEQGTRVSIRSLVPILLLIIVPVTWSQWRYYSYEEDGASREMVVVQPNYEPHYVKFRTTEQEWLRNFINLTQEAITENTAYVVYPESSFGYATTNTIENYPAVRSLHQLFSNYPQTKLIAGFNAYYIFEDGEPHTKAVRTQVRRQDTVHFEVLNIALQLDSQQDSIPIYRKSKLVPGPESFPFPYILFPFKFIADKLGGTTAGVGSQPYPVPFASDQGSIGAAICYESVFGEHYAGFVRRGAQAMTIITNDGWWDNTAGHRQHLHYASLRAIETRRSIARSANTGISAFINQRGEILQPTAYDEPAAIRGEVKLNDAITFYVKWGDLLGRIAFFVSIFLILNTITRILTKR